MKINTLLETVVIIMVREGYHKYPYQDSRPTGKIFNLLQNITWDRKGIQIRTWQYRHGYSSPSGGFVYGQLAGLRSNDAGFHPPPLETYHRLLVQKPHI